MPEDELPATLPEISLGGRILVLVTAFLGWMFAGTVMVIISLVGRSATIDLLQHSASGIQYSAFSIQYSEAAVGNWISRYICAFLLGAAAGGLLFGWLGDRIGRARAMGLSILCYSIFTGLTYFVRSPEQLLVMRFLACLGVGGMWPNGVSLASEAWSNVSRPILAGLIGMSANVGFCLLAWLAVMFPVQPDSWRWVLLACAVPGTVLGAVALAIVPESPRWLAQHSRFRIQHSASSLASGTGVSPVAEIFRRPLLPYTIIGICLGTIPLLGNWGGANWVIMWADKVGETLGEDWLKAQAQWSKSAGAVIGSLLGGWLASRFGRRRTYFVICFCALSTAMYLFWCLSPLEPGFLFWVFVLGFFGTVHFGWLPLYLPELFPTRVRSTGTGVTFNFGRVATAVGVLGTGQLMLHFDGNYAMAGRVICLVYLLGMVIIFFAPDTSRKQLQD